MNQEQGCALQEKVAREAMAMLLLAGAETDVGEFEEVVKLIGKAWNLPDESTQGQLALIEQEREAVRGGEATPHPLPGEDLLVNWSGLESLDVLEDMFETSLRLESFDERQAIFRMAMSLMECQNFMDWIEKTPGEEELRDFPKVS